MKNTFQHWRKFLNEDKFGDFIATGDTSSTWEMNHAKGGKAGYDTQGDSESWLEPMGEDCDDDEVISIASKAHQGQTRRDGEPYISHPKATADLARKFGYDELTVDVAYLHDSLEDATDPAEIEKMIKAVCPEALPLVKQLTHAKDIAYGDYVLALSPEALAVKLLDMHHNSMDLEPESKQYQKYHDALKKLQDQHGGIPAGVTASHWDEISAKFELDQSMETITERWRIYEQTITKKKIHQLADKLNIPWDDDPKFKKWTEDITGKPHLDDMTKDELSAVYSALKKKGANGKESGEADEL